jgi:RNA-directed DNA polymerase
MGKQMSPSKAVQPLTSTQSWTSIDWKKAQKEVRRLQMRIAKSVQEGKYGRVLALQWILTHSFYAKALAVKRVTSNKGRQTRLALNI